MERRFEGKTVIVTGASSGIGAGIARRFAAEGANVVLAARGKDKLQAVAGELDEARTLALETDVSDEGQVRAMVDAAVERFGGLDVLVSNAGMAMAKPFEETSFEDWRRTLAVDVDSCFLGAHAALPHLKASKGCIVHTASASGLGGDWNLVAYNAAKGAVVNFTRGLAVDLGRFGIRVNAVAPSLTRTDGNADALEGGEIASAFAERMPLPGDATPDDIAGAVAFLASDDARRITGVILPVDGGVTAGSGQPKMG